MEEVKKEKHIFLNVVIFIIICIALLFLYAKYIGVKGIKVKEYRIESSILTENFSGFKIVHFSDLLYKSTITKDDVKSLVDKINILKPDIVVFTGDLVDENIKLNTSDIDFLIESLGNINANIEKYAIYGDADFKLSQYEDIMEKSGFKILYNSYEKLYYKTNENIFIVGFPSSIKEQVDLSKAFEFYNDDERKYIIVLVHDGSTIKYLDNDNYEVDLILGGHSLNGSIVLPYFGGLFIDKYSYKYYDEKYERGITKIFISSGIGTNKYQYRFNNKPSINLYRLKAQS